MKYFLISSCLVLFLIPVFIEGDTQSIAQIPTQVSVQAPKPIALVQFGDVMLDRNVRTRMKNGVVPFARTEEIIKKFENMSGVDADFVIANLEGPIIETARNSCQQKPYSFQFPKSTAALLKENGIDLVNLSNNHSYDCYQAGIDSTRATLNAAGVGYFGGGTLNESYLISTTTSGQTIAFVGIDITVQTIPVENFYPLIQTLKKQNAYVIVNIHWGNEYELVQSSQQTQIGHAIIDSGADVVFGHHPHVVQPIETYKNRPIFYSLGNFIFDQIGEEQNKGLAAGVVLDGDSIQPFSIPIVIKESQPQLAN